MAEVKDKEKHWLETVLPALAPYKAVADLWTSTFFGNPLDNETYVARANTILGSARAARAPNSRPRELEGVAGGALNEASNATGKRQPGRANVTGTAFDGASNVTREGACAPRFFHWELEFPEVFFHEDGSPKQNPGFDAVIGYPPYGASLSAEEREFLQRHYTTALGYKNTALQFIESCHRSLNDTGHCGLIVPKSLTFSEGWKSGRELLLPRPACAADVSKAFAGVLL